jgi:hypothetical protein
MLANTTVINRVTQQTPTSPTSPSSGQIWRDGRKEANNRLFLVLDVDNTNQRAICQSIITGKITTPRLIQFNRGQTGYFYAGTLRDVASMYIDYMTTGPTNVVAAVAVTSPRPTATNASVRNYTVPDRLNLSSLQRLNVS